jgi:Rrf2 family protein
MKLSTRTRYGSRALTELAAAHPDRVLPLKAVAERQRLSVKYLEHIMTALKIAGLVKPIRGVNGGFVLARDPADVTLREVFEALEGSPATVECVDAPGSCSMESTCPTRETWVEMTEALAAVLERTTLQDLVARGKAKERQAGRSF